MLIPILMYTMASFGPGDDAGGEWWWLARLFFIVLWITVIALVVRWIVWGRGRRHESSPMERARGILAERYARGEIDAAEYRQRSEELR